MTETGALNMCGTQTRLGMSRLLGTGRAHTYWVIHELQILGPASDDDARPGLEGDHKAVPLPDVVACAPCMAHCKVADMAALNARRVPYLECAGLCRRESAGHEEPCL